jgi:SAM-dependent methyltransferase
MKSELQDHLSMVLPETWEHEYRVVHAIPSTLRGAPAKALVLFADLLDLSKKSIFDAGCGNGRNAVYLATRGCKVTAVDFSEAALAETRRRAKKDAVEGNVSVERVDLSAATPYANDTFDIVLDSYTFCHFLEESLSDSFWREMGRIVRPDGFLMSISFSVEDSYYHQFRSKDEKIVTDPSNGVSKRLYEEGELKRFFARLFRVEYFAKFEFPDVVHEQTYIRVVFVSILRPQVR